MRRIGTSQVGQSQVFFPKHGSARRLLMQRPENLEMKYIVTFLASFSLACAGRTEKDADAQTDGSAAGERAGSADKQDGSVSDAATVLDSGIDARRTVEAGLIEHRGNGTCPASVPSRRVCQGYDLWCKYATPTANCPAATAVAECMCPECLGCTCEWFVVPSSCDGG